MANFGRFAPYCLHIPDVRDAVVIGDVTEENTMITSSVIGVGVDSTRKKKKKERNKLHAMK